MAEFFELHDEIEAASARIYCRRPDFKCPVNDPVLGRSIRYKLDRNSSAMVYKTLSEEDLSNLKSRNSHTKEGDKLRADAIEFLCVGIRKEKFEDKEGASSTHGGNFYDTRTRTYAIITTPFSNLFHVFENKKRKEGETPAKSENPISF